MPVLLQSDQETAANIQCILSDVDGVMTDGRIIYDENGVETKRFHVHDGLGIKRWMKRGFGFGIITARTSNIVRQRAAELGIESVQQGYEDKGPAAQAMMESLGYSPQQVCYIGDDLPDIPVMQAVGLAVAPANGSTDACQAANWILRRDGGDGVLRELIERLLRAKNQWEDDS